MSEIIKVDITSTVAEKSIDAVKGFLQKLIGPPVEEIGLLLGDSVRLWRFNNQINILQQTENHIKTKNITTKKIPLKILVPLLENASLEDNETLRTKWVGLLVNYVDSTKNFNSSVFPFILSQISSNEAITLEYIKEKKATNSPHDVKGFTTSVAEQDNLVRLGLIRELLDVKANWDQAMTTSFSGYEITELGIEFLFACTLKD